MLIGDDMGAWLVGGDIFIVEDCLMVVADGKAVLESQKVALATPADDVLGPIPIVSMGGIDMVALLADGGGPVLATVVGEGVLGTVSSIELSRDGIKSTTVEDA